MTVIDFRDALRARLNRMADEHLAMQKALPNLAAHQVSAALDALKQHSIEMSRLVRAIHESPKTNAKQNEGPEAA